MLFLYTNSPFGRRYIQIIYVKLIKKIYRRFDFLVKKYELKFFKLQIMKHLNSILRRFRRTHQLKKIKSIENNTSKLFQICIVVPQSSPISISKKKEQETLVITFTLLFSGFL